jgi:hypothetical protein
VTLAAARFVATASILAAVAAIAAAPFPPDRDLIVPGTRIGPLWVGMTLAQAEAVMKLPASTFPVANGQDTIETWFATVRNRDGTMSMGRRGGLYVVVDSSGTVRQVGAHYAPRFLTATGLRTGVSEGAVRAALGDPGSVYQRKGYRELAYPAVGLTLSVVDDPMVRGYNAVYEVVVYASAR